MDVVVQYGMYLTQFVQPIPRL